MVDWRGKEPSGEQTNGLDLDIGLCSKLTIMSATPQGSGPPSTLPHTSVDNFSFANLSLTDTLEDLARYFTPYPAGSADRARRVQPIHSQHSGV